MLYAEPPPHCAVKSLPCRLEKARVIDPFRHAGLPPLGKIRLTLAGEIKMTPVEASAGEFFCSFETPCPGTAGINLKNYKNMIAKLKNILRCYAVGMGIKETANTFHLSRNTVRKYVRLFVSSGKTTEQLLELSEEHLREIFGCTEFRHREPSQRQLELDALIPGYVAPLSMVC